jgi:L-threonylcarbamoyladenylate synthase
VSEVEIVARAIRDGALAVLPTDTVYGLVCTAFRQQPAVDLYRLKGRNEIQPTAFLASSVDVLLECIPELRGRPAMIARALLPGPFTLVLPNPAGRFSWLSESRPETIGVRVPALTGPTAEIVHRLGAVIATSANLPGGPDPRRLDEVPAQILAGVAAALDGGELPGTPSTVIDITGSEPVVLRAGAGDLEAALALIAAAHT